MRSEARKPRRSVGLAALLLIILSAPVSLAGPPADGRRTFSGRAVAADTGELLYIEYHRQTYADNKLQKTYVKYVDAGGETLAVRSATFGDGFVPRSRYENRQSGMITNLAPAGSGYAVSIERKDGSNESGTVSAAHPVVAGLGLDPFIRSRQSEWTSGQSISFRMIVPTRMSAYTFRLTKAGERTVAGRDGIVLRLELAGVLGYLVEEILLTYDRESGDLLMYEGPAELKDSAGRKRDIRVTFRY